ncbi:MAG: GTP 3',8-cyclase MoaA [Planctomycetaceae bacterium]|nr:GTP 3',8-cyclase MoaA [Planctomycetaceae bacterium]
MTTLSPLVDCFGRVHTSLRLSVTDRCNLRCFYCMPESTQFMPRDEILSYEEIVRFVRVSVRLGINKLRITGGEPLVRSDLPDLIGMLRKIPGIEDIALTTNGIRLSEFAQSLKDAGLQRVNISLDTLEAETFREISRRDGLERVLEGISTAQKVGFEKLRLNALAIRGVNERDIVPLGEFARQQDLELRFIEFMPLDAENNWEMNRVISGADIRETLEVAFCRLVPLELRDRSQPAVDYRFEDGRGRIGFINSVTEPFCSTCNRLRLTPEGQIRNCLFSRVEWDACALLRSGGSDQDLEHLIRDCVRSKKTGHGIDSDDFQKPARSMYQIGG